MRANMVLRSLLYIIAHIGNIARHVIVFEATINNKVIQFQFILHKVVYTRQVKTKVPYRYVTNHIPFFLKLFDVCIEHPANKPLHVNLPIFFFKYYILHENFIKYMRVDVKSISKFVAIKIRVLLFMQSACPVQRPVQVLLQEGGGLLHTQYICGSPQQQNNY